MAEKWGVTRAEVDAFAINRQNKYQADIRLGANKEYIQMALLEI